MTTESILVVPRQASVPSSLGVLSGVPTIGVGKSLHRVDGLTKGTVAALTAQLDRRAPSGRLGTGHRTGVGRRDPATATSTGHR